MNIAEIGFKASTKDLDNAKVKLDALVPSAKKAGDAANRFTQAASGITKGTGGATAGIKSFQSAAMGAASSTDRLSKSAMASGTAMGTVQRAAAGAQVPLNNLVASAARVGTSFAAADAHIDAYRASLAKVPAAAQGAKTSLDRLGTAANDNINRLQSTPGNIAAQFQDIGVTAAAGMSPFLIALQQGTQLSSAMAGGVRNLLAGFAQFFSLTTLLTVGLVGLVAAGLQMIDWMEVAQSLLYGLADAMDVAAEAITYVGTVLLIAFAPQIIGLIIQMTVAIGVGLVNALKVATTSMLTFALANPFTALVIGIGIVIAAMYLLNDAFGGVFTDVLKTVKSAVNFVIGGFVGAFNTIVETWDVLPRALGAIMIEVANSVLGAIEDLINGSVSLINNVAENLPFGLSFTIGDVSIARFKNPFKGALNEVGAVAATEFGKAMATDYVGAFFAAATDLFGRGAASLRGIADGLVSEAKENDRSVSGRAATGGKSEAGKIAEDYANLIIQTEKRIAQLGVETKALGMGEYAARLYRNQQDLISKALEKNIPLTDDVLKRLDQLGIVLTNAEVDLEIAKQNKEYEKQVKLLDQQRALIGLSSYALEFAAARQEMLNDAVAAGIPITSEYNRILDERAAKIASMQQNNNELEFMADLAQSHKETMFAIMREAGELRLTGAELTAYRMETDLLLDARKEGIELGPKEIEQIKQMSREYALATQEIERQRAMIDFQRDSFEGFFNTLFDSLRQGESVWQSFGNAVLNVVNRIFDKLLELAISDAFAALTGNGGGGGLAAFFSGGGGSGLTGQRAPGWLGHEGGHVRFAKGGAFTNGLYDRPTAFMFGKGGSFGLMGEAGPEAVMPLKRGPDGSLGVRMYDRQPATVHVTVGVEDERFNAYVDDRADDRVAVNAPTIIDAGEQVNDRRRARRRSRVLNG